LAFWPAADSILAGLLAFTDEGRQKIYE
jgi:hypothetical protein